MSRARNRHEQDLLRGAKKTRLSGYMSGKECSNVDCSELGNIQPIENFYKHANGKPDSYCILCRRTANSMWKLAHPSKKTKPEGSINAGKAPWCKDHKKNSAKCGCAMGVFHKSARHRAKISAAMKGNTNARGKKNRHGPLSTEHKARISMSMLSRFKREKPT